MGQEQGEGLGVWEGVMEELPEGGMTEGVKEMVGVTEGQVEVEGVSSREAEVMVVGVVEGVTTEVGVLLPLSVIPGVRVLLLVAVKRVVAEGVVESESCGVGDTVTEVDRVTGPLPVVSTENVALPVALTLGEAERVEVTVMVKDVVIEAGRLVKV